MICGSGGSKSRLAKAAGAEPAGQMRDEKVHAVVARSTFPSQNVQNTPGVRTTFGGSDVETSARRCGAKHIFEVKMYKTHQVRTTFGGSDVEKVHAVVARSTFPSQNVKSTTWSGPLFEVQMSKKCTPVVAREAHFQVKSVKKLTVSDHFWRFRCRKSARRCGAKHISKSKC